MLFLSQVPSPHEKFYFKNHNYVKTQEYTQKYNVIFLCVLGTNKGQVLYRQNENYLLD